MGVVRVALVVVLAHVTGCIETRLAPCGDLLCPVGTTCVAALDGCYSTAAVDACVGRGEGEDCATAATVNGRCSGGVCLDPGCGNGVIDGGDDCEGTDLAGETCAGLGYDSGTLGCTASCRFDTSGCVGICGDGLRAPDEACDGTDVAGEDCQSLGFYEPGAVSCTAACTFGVEACSGRCGDAVVNGPELCDGSLPARSCADIGFDFGATSCSAICGVELAGCRDIGWRHVLSVPGYLSDVAGNSPSNVYVGGGAAIYHYDGQVWSEFDPQPTYALWVDTSGVVFSVKTPTTLRVVSGSVATEYVVPAPIRDIWGRASNDVYLVGDGGRAFHFDGTSITSLATGVTAQLLAVSGNATTLFAVGAAGTIVRLDQGGWTTMPSTTSERLRAVWVDPSGAAFAVGDNATILHHAAGSWAAIQSPIPGELVGVWGTSVEDVFASGLDQGQGGRGVMLHFDGAIWRQLDIDAPAPLTQIWGAGTEVYAVSSDGTAQRSTGLAWAVLPPPSGVGNATGAYVARSGTLLVLDQASGLFRSDNAGWTNEFPGFGYYSSMWAASTSDVYVVGPGPGSGFFSHYDGTTWTESTVIGSATFRDASGLGPGNVFVVGESGGFFHFDGTNLTRLPSPNSSATLNAVWAASATDVFAAGDGGAIFRYQSGTWVAMSSGTTAAINDLWGSGPNDVHAVGEAGTLLHFDGTAWTSPLEQGSTFATIRAVSGTGPTDVFAAGDRLLYHFDGSTWSPVRLRGARDYGGLYATLRTVLLADDSGAVDVLLRR